MLLLLSVQNVQCVCPSYEPLAPFQDLPLVLPVVFYDKLELPVNISPAECTIKQFSDILTQHLCVHALKECSTKMLLLSITYSPIGLQVMCFV